MPYEKIPDSTRALLSQAVEHNCNGEPGQFKSVMNDIIKAKAIEALGNYRQSMYGGHGYTDEQE